MALFRRMIALGTLVAGSCATSLAQLSTNCAAAAATSPAPCVYQVDPPNWWTDMPAPMLLLYGRNLKGAQISVNGTGVSVTRTQFSENGHYAFVWLSDQASAPESIALRVTSTHGAITLPYELQQRKPASEGFQGFSAKDSMYLIMIDRFAAGDTANDGADHAAELLKPRGWHGGDLRGVTKHLDYLQSLGVTTVWITPVYANEGEPESYHGYGATDVYRVDPHYGTLADLQALGDALHQRQMKLVLDMVPNHVGPKHPWVKDEPEPDWFHGTEAKHDRAQGEFAPLINPHAPWRDQKDILDGWFADVLPDMNQENPDVSQYLIQNTIWWIEQAAADGIRIDTFPYVDRLFWHAYHSELHAVFPRLTSVGEAFNPDPVITSAFAGGVMRDDLNGQVDTGLWTPFDFPTFFTLRDVLLKGAPMTELAKVWGEDSLYPHPERLVPFLGNHDTSRFMSMPGATVAEMKLGFAILLTMRGMPQIYSGDEIAMRGGDDPENRHDFPGGFPDNKQDAFTSAGRTLEQNEMHDWVAGLLRFRNSTAVFADGGQQDIMHNATSFVYARSRNLKAGCEHGDPGRVLVAVNNAEEATTLQVDATDTTLEGCAEFVPAAGTHIPVTLKMRTLILTLGPKQVAIYDVR
jgi:neopullulanase